MLAEEYIVIWTVGWITVKNLWNGSVDIPVGKNPVNSLDPTNVNASPEMPQKMVASSLPDSSKERTMPIWRSGMIPWNQCVCWLKLMVEVDSAFFFSQTSFHSASRRKTSGCLTFWLCLAFNILGPQEPEWEHYFFPDYTFINLVSFVGDEAGKKRLVWCNEDRVGLSMAGVGGCVNETQGQMVVS